MIPRAISWTSSIFKKWRWKINPISPTKMISIKQIFVVLLFIWASKKMKLTMFQFQFILEWMRLNQWRYTWHRLWSTILLSTSTLARMLICPWASRLSKLNLYTHKLACHLLKGCSNHPCSNLQDSPFFSWHNLEWLRIKDLVLIKWLSSQVCQARWEPLVI